jgi:hypothetical protein
MCVGASLGDSKECNHGEYYQEVVIKAVVRPKTRDKDRIFKPPFLWPEL